MTVGSRDFIAKPPTKSRLKIALECPTRLYYGPLRIEVPRERSGSLEPVLIPKHERRFTGFDEKIARLLEPMYPVVFFDCLRVKIREDAVVRNKAIYLALGILPDGTRDILGLWIKNTEGAKFWMKVFNDLKTREAAGESPLFSVQHLSIFSLMSFSTCSPASKSSVNTLS